MFDVRQVNDDNVICVELKFHAGCQRSCYFHGTLLLYALITVGSGDNLDKIFTGVKSFRGENTALGSCAVRNFLASLVFNRNRYACQTEVLARFDTLNNDAAHLFVEKLCEINAVAHNSNGLSCGVKQIAGWSLNLFDVICAKCKRFSAGLTVGVRLIVGSKGAVSIGAPVTGAPVLMSTVSMLIVASGTCTKRT